jgi:beta-glucanase (GH16 family)
MRLRTQGLSFLETVRTGLKARHYICLLVVVSLLSQGGGAQKHKTPEDYTLVWSDEFNGKDGSLPDASKWTYDIGGSGWGNHELEYYTNRAENARIEDGKLVITARQEAYTGPDGAKFNYTSARLKSQDLFSQAYGRFEARIKLPAGQKLSDDFHFYAAEWEPGAVRFYLDANLYATFTSAQWPTGGTWVFDHRFFLILNVAVGGDWPGAPDGTTVFPQTMRVDYVRVYKRKM